MTYATYDYYTNDFRGKALSEQDFPKYARRASEEMNHVTFGRLSKLPADQITDAMRDCMCDVAEWMQHNEELSGSEVVSENNDGYSISYRDAGDTDSQKHEMYSIIRSYLAVTGLMYRGVDRHDLCDA